MSKLLHTLQHSPLSTQTLEHLLIALLIKCKHVALVGFREPMGKVHTLVNLDVCLLDDFANVTWLARTMGILLVLRRHQIVVCLILCGAFVVRVQLANTLDFREALVLVTWHNQ